MPMPAFRVVVLMTAASFATASLSFRIETPFGEVKGDDVRIPPPPNISPPKLPFSFPDPTRPDTWTKPENWLPPHIQAIPGAKEATVKTVEQVGNAVVVTIETASKDTIRTLANAHGEIVTTVQKAGDDALKSIEKAGKDAAATYVKAWKDTAEQGKRSLNDAADAGRAIARFEEREFQARLRAGANAAKRVREGKIIDAAWHIGTDRAQATEENFFKATQESSVINAAGQAAATAYGGPGGAAAYAAWYTYRTTGDPDLALRAGILSAITSQGGSAVSGMPAGTATEIVKKAAVAGAVGGLAVAAAGGDEKAVTEAFLRSGGAVIVQSSTDSFRMHNPKAADAIQTVHCISSKDMDCLSKTTFVKDTKGKLLYDEKGNTRIQKYVPDQVTKWTQPAPNSPEAKQVEILTSVSKFAKTGEVPIMGGKWVVTSNFGKTGDAKKTAPSVVLTYAGSDPPLIFRSDYEYGQVVSAFNCDLAKSTRQVKVTSMGKNCKAMYFREGESQTIFESTQDPARCKDAAASFVNGRLKELGATCKIASGA